MSTVMTIYALLSGTIIEVAQGDLTKEPVDAIVNAANDRLSHGAGVAAAIANAGGPTIQQESNAWVRKNGLVTNREPAVTGAGKMPARYVIHAVGPVWGEGDEDRKLVDAIRGSLERAEELKLRTIAFPAISTGIFGFPKDRAAQIFFEAFRDYFAEKPDSQIERVRLTLWDDDSVAVFLKAGSRVFGQT